MAHEPVDLKEADAVEITTVLDNTCDMLLAGNRTVRRPSLGEKLGRKVLVAEHGFSAVGKDTAGNTSESMLGGFVRISGEIHRTTDFETGFPIHWTRRGKKW